MSRKIIQDIISRVTPSSRHEDDNGEEKKSVWKPILLILVGSALVLGLFLLFSSAFSRVSVKITTTKKDINMDDIVFLNKDGAGGGVQYKVMKFDDTASNKVAVTGSKITEKSATGSVTIYNSYSSAFQKLVVGTRLETKDGRIYKILYPVTVPGLSISDGKVMPGAVDVSVIASVSGPAYNTPPTSFTIPGLKGSPKYQKFYAKSGKDITGGFSGQIRIALPADILKVRAKLQEGLKQKLTKSALAQVPAGFLLYEDTLFFTFKDNTVGNSSMVDTSGAPGSLNVTGTLNAVIIRSDDLNKLVADKKLADAGQGAKITISNLDKLVFKVLNKDKINVMNNDSIATQVTGKLSAVWDINENVLKEKLVGIKKSDYQNVFKDFPAIENAAVVFSPSWAFYFPSDVSRIKIDK